MTPIARFVGVVMLLSLSGCAGDGALLDASGDSTTTSTTAVADPTSLPVTYDGGQTRFDPPDGIAPKRTEAEVRRSVHAHDDSTVLFALYTSWNTGHMHDDGSVGPDHVRQPVWMIRTPDVPQTWMGSGGARGLGEVTTTSAPTPTTVLRVDMLGVVDDASGAAIMTRADTPDNPTVPWTGGPPKAQRAASCPYDLAQYGEAGLINDGGTATPLSSIRSTQPRAVVRADNGDAYLVWGGEGSVDREVSPTNTGDGVVMVTHYPADPCQTIDSHWGQLTFHHEPSRSGILTLTGLDGDLVSYRTADGTTGTYNVVTEAFAAH